MGIIYEPKGKAREYSPLAINLYGGCNHGCKYCYVPSIFRKGRDQFIEVTERKQVIKNLKKEVGQYKNSKVPVMFSFTTDPYNELDQEMQLTRQALEILLENKIPVVMLSKAGKPMLRDLDLYKQFGKHIYVGATLTFSNEKDSLNWEPGAALPEERYRTLQTLKDEGLITWASFEPVIDPVQSFMLVKKFIDVIDFYKIGKLNNYKGLDKQMDWREFLTNCVNYLRPIKKRFYVKNDLVIESRMSAELTEDETNKDHYLPEPF